MTRQLFKLKTDFPFKNIPTSFSFYFLCSVGVFPLKTDNLRKFFLQSIYSSFLLDFNCGFNYTNTRGKTAIFALNLNIVDSSI